MPLEAQTLASISYSFFTVSCTAAHIWTIQTPVPGLDPDSQTPWDGGTASSLPEFRRPFPSLPGLPSRLPGLY